MMKESVQKALIDAGILPINNSNWRTFDIVLYSDSPVKQYENVKRKILDTVGNNVGGIYVISRQNTILYIGESARNIHNRLIRHMNKIYIRKEDYRAKFFKLREHQGELTIYYYPLPEKLIGKRKAIEQLLTIVLEPEYIRWDIQNKVESLL